MFVFVGCGEVTEEGANSTTNDAKETESMLEGYDFGGAQVGDDGSGPVSEQPARPRIVEEQLGAPAAERLRAERRAQDRTDSRPEPTSDPTARALDEASDRDPGELLRLVVELEDVPFDFSRFRGAPASERRELVDQRRQTLAPLRQQAEARVTKLGGEVVNDLWIDNSLLVDMPAGAAAELVEMPVVEGLDTISDGGGPDYDGTEMREGLRADDFHDEFMYGGSGGQDDTNGIPIKIAIFEYDNEINTEHVGWNDWSSGPTRIAHNQDCTSGSCTSANTSSSSSHGTRVSWVAAGNIEQNQDDDVSDSDEQAQHSGVTRESEIYYYNINDSGDLQSAMQDALAEGVDVINMSFYLTCSGHDWCDADYDCSGVNSWLDDLLDAGIVPVQSAGNTNNDESDECSVNWPAFRNEVVSVTSLDSRSGDDYDDSIVTDDETGTTSQDASEGPVEITTRGGIDSDTAGVDIAAPGHISEYFTYGEDNYGSFDRWGTSYSAPAVTAGAGLLREALEEVGWTYDDARALMTNLLLLGDRSDGTSDGYKETGVSDLSGLGRLKLHWPDGENMTSPWHWAWKWVTIEDGETITWELNDGDPLSSNVEVWKWVAHWFDDDLTSVSDITISVYDTCPDDGGSDEYIAGDASFAIRKQVRLKGEDVAGRCLELRAKAYDVPPGGIALYSAEYYDGGDISEH